MSNRLRNFIAENGNGNGYDDWFYCRWFENYARWGPNKGMILFVAKCYVQLGD